MKVEMRPFGEVVEFQRTSLEITPNREYARIGIYSWGKGMMYRDSSPGTEMGAMKYFTFPTPSLIFSNIQAWEGAVALATEDDAEYVCSSRFYPYVPKDPKEVSLRYLYEFFRSTPGLNIMRGSSPGTQVRNKVLSKKSLEEALIPIPPRADQDRIATHLDSLSERVQAMSRGNGHDFITSLPSILKLLFPAEQLGEVTLSELCTNDARVVHPGEGTLDATAFIGLEHIEPHSGRQIGSAELGDQKGPKHYFRPGQVLYTRLRPYLNKSFAPSSPGITSVEQLVLTPSEHVYSQLLGLLLRSAHVLTQSIEATNSLQLPRISLRDFMAFTVPDIRRLPSPEATLEKANRLTDCVIRASAAAKHRDSTVAAIVPAARNEIFDSML